MAGGEKLDRRQRDAAERMVLGLDQLRRADPEVQIAALQHGDQVGAHRLRHLDLHVGIALGIAVQERREDAVDHLRRGAHLQHPGVLAPQQARALAERFDRAQDAAAIRQQLLARAGQHQAAAHAIEQRDTECGLERADLAGQRGLGHAQSLRRLGHGPLLGDGHERPQVVAGPCRSLCRPGMKQQANTLLDG